MIGMIAIKMLQVALTLLSLKRRFYLSCQRTCHLKRPLRRQTRMGHDKACLWIIMHERLMTEPCEQTVPIRGPEHRQQRVIGCPFTHVFGKRQQMQVMIPKDYPVTIAKRTNKTQDFQGTRATVDKITGQPERIGGWIEINLFEQSLERVQATLKISDRIRRHKDFLFEFRHYSLGFTIGLPFESGGKDMQSSNRQIRKALLEKSWNLASRYKAAPQDETVLRDEVDDTLAELEKALAHAPNDAALWCEKGALLFMRKDFQNALASFEQAIRLAPKRWGYYYRMAFVLKKDGQYEKCIDYCNKIPIDAPKWGERAIKLKTDSASLLSSADFDDDAVIIENSPLLSEVQPAASSIRWSLAAWWTRLWQRPAPSSAQTPLLSEVASSQPSLPSP